MAAYSPVVAFTCHFSETVALRNVDRVFIPNIDSITPREGESDTFVVRARVQDNTLGAITLVLGAGAFKSGDALSEEYRVSVSYDFIRDNVNVVAEIEKMSMTPDYAVVRIAGGQTVLQQVEAISDIAVFPPCMTVLAVASTIDSYLVTVYLNDPAAVRSSTIRVKEGVIRAYWGSKRNVEKDVSVMVKKVVAEGEPIALWPATNTLFVRNAEFQVDVTPLFQNGCKVDVSSFSGINVDVVDVAVVDEVATLTGRIVDAEAPASLKFVGYVANSCEVAAYPSPRSVMVVKEEVPTYSIAYVKSETGCADVHVQFTAPVMETAEGVSPLKVQSTATVQTRDVHVNTNAMGLFTQIDGTVCVDGQFGVVRVNVELSSVVAPSGEEVSAREDTEFIISKEVLVLSLKSDYSARLRKGVYAMRNEMFSLTFEPSNEYLMAVCDFSKAFSSDYLVELSASRAGTDVAVSVLAKSIDYHTIAFDASKVSCEGSFSVEFHPSEFKFAYDPYFVPGDILITRVNSYYSPEFDFVPLRKVFPWDRVFFTDEGWVYIGGFGFFVDHGSDGCISWSPKTDVPAGMVQQWSYKEMTESLSREVPREVSIDYSFQYEKHGFLLDFQDNLFIYTTDDQDESARYDSTNVRFIFGVYWSSSEWAPRNATYEQITAEQSVLPDELTGYSIALGLQARPVPRGVNYMSINQNKFTAFTNTYYHMIEKIIDRSNWETSQKDRFPLSATVSYVERPMDFTYAVDVDEAVGFRFAFRTPYTFSWDTSKMVLTFNGERVDVLVIVINFEAYLTAERPLSDGEMELRLEKGAFTYTTDTTPPYTFESESFSASVPIFSRPQLSVTFDPEKLLQTVTVESSTPCMEWDMENIAEAILVKEDPMEAAFAFRKTESADHLVFPSGFCVTYGGELSARVATAAVTATYSPVEALMVKGVHFKAMKSNAGGEVEVAAAMDADWVFDESAPLLGEDAALLASFAEGVATLAFNRSSPVGECGCVQCACAEAFNTLTLPGGLFTKGQERSIPRSGLVWDFSDALVDVLAHVELPWKEPVTGESVRDAVFDQAMAPDVGSRLPNEVLLFGMSCAGLGFQMDSAFRTVIPVAIMHGLCSYGVTEEAVRDSYGNTNAEFQQTVQFDFRAPVGNAGLLDSAEKTEADLSSRYFWNRDPVVAIFFDEVLEGYNATDFLVVSDRCFVELLSYTIEEERSVVKYALHDCEEETAITLTVVPGVVLRDAYGNEALSEEAILHMPLTFELDTTVPTVTLSAASTLLYGDTIDVSYALSEARTTFSCEAIGVAVQESAVSITAVGEDTCRYTFSPLPVNGTYVIFFVPEGRFFDEAGNPNAPSNTLTPLALNKGAQIEVSAPEYTSEVQTEFQVSIDYTWLCTNYEHIFPSTFQYDRDIARIEKTGSVVSEEGRITQTFVITFFNFETFPEERYKNMPIFIPSMVCTNALALPNNAAVFRMTFDSKPTVPAFDLVLEGAEERNFDVTISFPEMKAFGEEEPAHYVSVEYEHDAVDCEVTREVVAGAHRYNAKCPLHKAGTVQVTVHRGAAVEMTGLPSSNFTRTFYIDATPPTITLTPRQTTFGPEVQRVEVAMTLSDPLESIPASCFVLENTEGLRVDVDVPTAVLMGNTLVGVTLARTSTAVTQGSFSMYVKAQCARNVHNNWNQRSNTVTLQYDFVAPQVTLNCPREDVVLNTVTVTGSFDKPCAFLAPTNIQAPASCVVRDIDMISPVAFSFSLSCYAKGRFEFSLKGYKDLVGNVGRQSESCSASFTLFGPSIKSTVLNLVNEQYVNTAEFEIDFTAAPNCSSMNLTSDFFVVQNAEDVATRQISSCHWVMTGRNVEEGNVFVRVKENAAVDKYGGTSLSQLISFLSYQSRPAVMSVSPKRFAARKSSDVTVCYDWNVARGLGGMRTEGACSDVTLKRVENNCAVLNVAITQGERCFLYLEADFVQAEWQLGSEGRYLFLDVDDSAPVVDATMTAGVRELAPVDDVFTVNTDGVVSVVVPAGVTVYPSLLTYSSPACVQSVQIEQLDEVKISVAFGDEKCAVAFDFKAGFFKDSFGRASPARTLTVSFDQEPLVVDIAVPQFSRETPILACATFNKKTVLAAENVLATVPVAISHSESCDNLIELTPAESGDFEFNLANVQDVFGNTLPLMDAVPFSLYISQPVAEPVSPVTLSTLAATTSETVVFAFNHKMATPPTALEELFAMVVPEDTPEGVSEGVKVEDVLTLEAISFSEDHVNVTLSHRPTTAATAEYTLSLLPTAFVDLAGNTLAETTFVVELDNQPPTVTASVNGDGFFAGFPLTLTLEFSKEVLPVADYFNKVTAEVNGVAIAFTGEAVTRRTKTLTVTSANGAEFSLGDAMSVVMHAGMVVDAFGMASPRSEDVLEASNGAVLVSQKMLSNSRVELVFNMGVLSVFPNKIVATGVTVYRIDGEDRKVIVTLQSSVQGAWTLRFLKGAILGTDESEESPAFTVSGVWDTVDPVALCDVPSMIGEGEVSFSCVFSKPVFTQSQFFEVTREDVVINHEERWEDKTLVVSFVGIETRVPGYKATVRAELVSCEDAVKTNCLPVLFEMAIDFTPVTMSFTVTTPYVHQNVSVEIMLAADRILATPLSKEMIEVTAPEMGLATVEQLEPFIGGLLWKLTAVFQSADMDDMLVPFTLTFPAGIAHDAVGNANTEATLELLLKDSAPTLVASSAASEGASGEKEVTVMAVVMNGPMSELPASAMEWSDNLQLVHVDTNTTELMSVFTVEFRALCNVSCDYWVRFVSEHIYDDAGNRLENDVMETGRLALRPVLTFQENQLCGDWTCSVVVESSENIDLDCQALVMFEEEYSVLPHRCLNTRACSCEITGYPSIPLSFFSFTVPENAAMTSDHLGNLATESPAVYHIPRPIAPALLSDWKSGDSIKDIPFVTGWLVPGMTLDVSMLACKNCEIFDWAPSKMDGFYTFKVSFFDASDRYAVVSVSEGAVIDPLGRPTLGAEFVLRREAEAPRVVRFRASSKGAYSVMLEFSKEVKPCGGDVVFTPENYPGYTTRVHTGSSAVKTTGRMVEVRMDIIGTMPDTLYNVAFTSDAFCDESSYPMDTECAFCTFRTQKGAPLPPSADVQSTTSTSITLTYEINFSPDTVSKLIVTTIPSSELPPVVVASPAARGTVTVEGLEPSTEYDVYVVLVNSYGDSFPRFLRATTLAGVPKPAADLRVCDVIDPQTVGQNSYVYTHAKACWTPSVSRRVKYILTVTPLDHEAMEATQFVTEESSVEFSVGNDVTHYRLTLTTVNEEDSEIAGASEAYPSISGEFVTAVDLEQIYKYPQGAGIKVVAERLTGEKAFITFSHPLENYFKIERYLVQYGNVFEDVFNATNHAIESLPFRMEQCKGNAVTVTVRVGVLNGFYGMQSNRVTVYCKRPRLVLRAEAGFNFVSYTVASEVETTATCTLKASYAADVLAKDYLSVMPSQAKANLFKSLEPDTEYTIDCDAYDNDYAVFTGRITFTTTSDFRLPAMALGAVEDATIGASFVEIPVAAVNMPGTVYCLAAPAGQFLSSSRGHIMRKGFSAYVFPQSEDKKVLVSGLKADTHYHAVCIFEPDFAPALVASTRRLADQVFEFTTRTVPAPQWVDFWPKMTGVVPVNTVIALTARLPVRDSGLSMTLVCKANPEFTQDDLDVTVDGNVVLITPRRLQPGMEYTLVVPAGAFSDVATNFPLPAITENDGLSFIVTSDPAMITPPTVTQAVADAVAMKVEIAFDRNIQLHQGVPTVSVPGLDLKHEEVEVRENKLVLTNMPYFPTGVPMTVYLPAGFVCNTFGACMTERQVLEFSVGSHDFEPTLMRLVPANNEERVYANTDVELVFNKEVVLDDAFTMTFTDETGHAIKLRYAEEKDKLMGNLIVSTNMVIAKGTMLPAGHTYVVTFDPMLITDSQGRRTRNLPQEYKFTYSQYPCSGNYIYEDMGEECSCFSTLLTCECHCGKETQQSVMVRLYLEAIWYGCLFKKQRRN